MTDKRQDSTTQAERYENKRLRRGIHLAIINRRRAPPQEEDTMANQGQLDLLKQGRIVFWNTWRREHPSLRPDISGANLWGAILRETALSGAILREATLDGADLTRADLSGARLREADLTEADLSEARLKGALLTRADLMRANLSRANLTGAYLYGADLSGADLTQADLSNTKLNEETLITKEQIGQAKPGTNA